MKQTFEIPGRFVSLNEFYRMNPYEQSRTKREHDERVAWCAKVAKLKPHSKRVKYHVLWVETNRRRQC